MDRAEEIVTESNGIERKENHLNAEQHALLRELLKPGAKVDALIPNDVLPSELWQILEACSHGLGKLYANITRLTPIIGQILMRFERQPSLYKDLGYQSFREFLRKGVYDELGLHHSAGYEALRLAKEWPQVTPDEYVKIGPKKFNIIAKTGATGKSSNARILLETAATMKVGEFRQYAEQRGLIAPGEATGATIMIPTNRVIYGFYRQVISDPKVHSVVGSKEPDQILKAMMEACYGEWVAQYEEQKAAEREERIKKAYEVTSGTETRTGPA